MGKPIIDLTGQTFGRLTVLGLAKRPNGVKGTAAYWQCRCECGELVVVISPSLRSGKTKSCGCYNAEATSKRNAARFTIHGLSNTLTGESWNNLMQRCFNSHHPHYPHYGGRGIVPCEFIKASPLNLVLLIGFRPAKELTLDRIDNSLGYNCGNCAECIAKGLEPNVRWATKTQQARNRRSVHWVEIDGAVRCVTEWAEVLGVSRDAFYRKYVNRKDNEHHQLHTDS